MRSLAPGDAPLHPAVLFGLDLVELVRDFLPEREHEILEETTPSAQMALFASHFEDRYLPLHPSFRDGECEDEYYELLRDIPVIVMGFGWEDYHDLDNARLGCQLMSYLFEPPSGDSDQAGERVALIDGFSPQYQHEAQRVTAGGITLNAARRIFKGQKWAGVDAFTGKVVDAWEEGIIEPLKIKTQAVSSASEVAVMILRIDDVIASSSSGDRNRMPPMPEGGEGGHIVGVETGHHINRN